ncbi:hypothetical protein BDZ94DRAFT_1262540 [Collybia nuda]|uniref:Uncharacterized protein n=1 Tax=Collybia nuda TaxID=64659 RepID=A0A9P6CIK6_9AGAR|nr:hypothetical protein BDZ94DRAFT_1262540 [Collybia nuda]
MASQSILRTLQSPSRAMIMPASTRSILKRPEPLPLSPNPFPFSTTFSVVLSSAKPSPHVHFPPSPAMAATFTAHSANTYDRGPIIVSPSSLDVPSWGNRIRSPCAPTFKLSDPPKRTPGAAKTPRDYNLAVPTVEDPRSPKPYRPRAGIKFDELSFRVPREARAQEGLARALTIYPRSPYPSAPITPTEDKENDSDTEVRGRTLGRWPNRSSRGSRRRSPPSRARSLEVKQKRRQNIGPHVSSPLLQHFLSPVQESPHTTRTTNPGVDSVSSESTRLSQAFWQSVSLHEGGDSLSFAFPVSPIDHHGFLASPVSILFGNKDGSLWSPGPQRKEHSRLTSNVEVSMLSPAQKRAFSKSMVASPSPNDPFSAFPSFSVALMGVSGDTIAYPPRVLVEQD